MYERPKKQSNFDDVGDFHEKFGLDNVTNHFAGPREVDRELLRFRLQFMLEEILEFAQGAGFQVGTREGSSEALEVRDLGTEVDHAEAFDALLDLVYVAHGTAHLMGYPWQRGWAAVQHANMSKVRAQPDGSDSKRGSSFDVVKPEGWKPPDIGAILNSLGWPMMKENDQ